MHLVAGLAANVAPLRAFGRVYPVSSPVSDFLTVPLVGVDGALAVATPECENVTIIRTAAQDEEFFQPILENFFEGLAPSPVG